MIQAVAYKTPVIFGIVAARIVELYSQLQPVPIVLCSALAYCCQGVLTIVVKAVLFGLKAQDVDVTQQLFICVCVRVCTGMA